MSINIPQPREALVDQSRFITRVWWRYLQTVFGILSGGGVAVSGAIADFAGSVPPNGWLVCDGSAVSRAEFSALFGAIGVTWGIGDGSTTFNLPDFGGRVLLGANASFPLGSKGGAATATITVAELPAHNHPVIDPTHTHAFAGIAHTHTFTGTPHTHTITDPGHVHAALVAASTDTTGTDPGTATTGNTGSATTGITINNATAGGTNANTTAGGTNADAATGVTTGDTGSGDPLAILPPYAAVLKIIKT